MSTGEAVDEPSMDEILSSIRKIIAEDEVDDAPQATKTAEAELAPAAAFAVEGVADDEILELTADDELIDDTPADAELPAAPLAAADDVDDDIDVDDLLIEDAADGPALAVLADATAEVAGEPEPDAEGQPPAQAEVEVEDEAVEAPPSAAESAPASDDAPLVGAMAAVAATDAFHRISQAVAPGDAVPGGDRTIEVFLADLLRPELKNWLDTNLPSLVERIVEREIKKLVRDAQPE
ncbi:MAG: DUF2497 domain-containing protein [Pseudomonadota bacterium]